LLLDEAHLLPMPVLDQLHILLNFQRDSKPWLSIILVGLPELREILKRNVLQSLTGRIAIRVHLPPLDADQVKQYVRQRMTAAGCQREVFAQDGLLLISKATGGIMRRIDVLATRCLELAAPGKSNLVDATVPKPPSAIARRHCCERLNYSGAFSRRAAFGTAHRSRFECAMAD
jgi:type II secretory pathway predicted ATPase ExeA